MVTRSKDEVENLWDKLYKATCEEMNDYSVQLDTDGTRGEFRHLNYQPCTVDITPKQGEPYSAFGEPWNTAEQLAERIAEHFSE